MKYLFWTLIILSSFSRFSAYAELVGIHSFSRFSADSEVPDLSKTLLNSLYKGKLNLSKQELAELFGSKYPDNLIKATESMLLLPGQEALFMELMRELDGEYQVWFKKELSVADVLHSKKGMEHAATTAERTSKLAEFASLTTVLLSPSANLRKLSTLPRASLWKLGALAGGITAFDLYLGYRFMQENPTLPPPPTVALLLAPVSEEEQKNTLARLQKRDEMVGILSGSLISAFGAHVASEVSIAKLFRQSTRWASAVSKVSQYGSIARFAVTKLPRVIKQAAVVTVVYEGVSFAVPYALQKHREYQESYELKSAAHALASELQTPPGGLVTVYPKSLRQLMNRYLNHLSAVHTLYAEDWLKGLYDWFSSLQSVGFYAPDPSRAFRATMPGTKTYFESADFRRHFRMDAPEHDLAHRLSGLQTLTLYGAENDPLSDLENALGVVDSETSPASATEFVPLQFVQNISDTFKPKVGYRAIDLNSAAAKFTKDTVSSDWRKFFNKHLALRAKKLEKKILNKEELSMPEHYVVALHWINEIELRVGAPSSNESLRAHIESELLKFHRLYQLKRTLK